MVSSWLPLWYAQCSVSQRCFLDAVTFLMWLCHKMWMYVILIQRNVPYKVVLTWCQTSCKKTYMGILRIYSILWLLWFFWFGSVLVSVATARRRGQLCAPAPTQVSKHTHFQTVCVQVCRNPPVKNPASSNAARNNARSSGSSPLGKR